METQLKAKASSTKVSKDTSKLKQKQNNLTVQGTNDSSIVSKCSMCAKGYFDDDLIQCFVSKTANRASLINRGYYVRAKAMDFAVRNFLQQVDDTFGTKKQIISLGAGFDSTYFRLQKDEALGDTKYFEVDFPEVVERKRQLIMNEDRLLSLVEYPEEGNDCVVLQGKNYMLAGVDLSDLDKLLQCLEAAGVNKDCPTLFISEVVITYMEAERSSALIAWCAKHFSSSAFVSYEQVHPDDSFGKVMVSHFEKIQSALKGIHTWRTPQCQQQRYLQLGFDECSVINMNTFYNNFIPEQERSRIEQLEPFDEFEEWHLKCAHYILLVASKGSLKQLSQLLKIEHNSVAAEKDRNLNETQLNRHASTVSWSVLKDLKCSPQAYGHTSTLLGKDQNIVITIGGFGQIPNGVAHGRVKDILIHDLVKCHLLSNAQSMATLERMYHTATAIEDNTILVFGGRLSPTKPCSSLLLLEMTNVDRHDATTSSQLTGASQDNSQISIKEMSASGDYPVPRWRHTATFLPEFGNRGTLLVYGGRNHEVTAMEDCYLLDLKSTQWKKLDSSGECPEARHSHSAALWKPTQVIIAGGLGVGQQPLNSVWCLDVSTGVWQRVQVQGYLQARYSHQCCITEDSLILVGGVGLQAHHFHITTVHLLSGILTDYSLDPEPEFPLMLHNHSLVHLEQKQTLLVTGGGGNCFSFGTHLNNMPIVMQLSDLLHNTA